MTHTPSPPMPDSGKTSSSALYQTPAWSQAPNGQPATTLEQDRRFQRLVKKLLLQLCPSVERTRSFLARLEAKMEDRASPLNEQDKQAALLMRLVRHSSHRLTATAAVTAALGAVPALGTWWVATGGSVSDFILGLRTELTLALGMAILKAPGKTDEQLRDAAVSAVLAHLHEGNGLLGVGMRAFSQFFDQHDERQALTAPDDGALSTSLPALQPSHGDVAETLPGIEHHPLHKMADFAGTGLQLWRQFRQVGQKLSKLRGIAKAAPELKKALPHTFKGRMKRALPLGLGVACTVVSAHGEARRTAQALHSHVEAALKAQPDLAAPPTP
ncbi:hypothetical protein E3E12_04605 [Formicincola oecophyllae]|uniref:EcsC family protein n=1 Tax=Formicincola oecophyllae TaxID=2558361 RepID=A0A4Y6U8A3_9PROT|nr:hypothetical protein [Formicincola oecophyllae]QDH13592.1 hypothetical protein E3E12_04605 [Formicincola oecophyllae]